MNNKKRSEKIKNKKKAAIVPETVAWLLYILLGAVLLLILYIIFKGKFQGAINYIKDWLLGG